MRLPLESPASTVMRELTDADRARIDARNQRLATTREFAEAGLVVGEDLRKVGQLYAQLSAQATERGEEFPSLDTWLRQRAQERIAQGYTPTRATGTVSPRFEAAMSEAVGLAEAGRPPAGVTEAPPKLHADVGAPSGEQAKRLAEVDGVLGQLALGQQVRAAGGRVDE